MIHDTFALFYAHVHVYYARFMSNTYAVFM